jgi:hypothetical protein
LNININKDSKDINADAIDFNSLIENPLKEKPNDKSGPSLAGGIININAKLKKNFNEE